MVLTTGNMIKYILSIIMTLLSVNSLFSMEVEKLWGISKTELVKNWKIEDYSTFKPEDNPKYSNRIIDFFSAMKSEEKVIIYIIRTNGIPEIDYCFFNEKLYSVSEDWGDVDKTKSEDLINTIKQKYSEISTEEKKSYIINSFKKDKTKVLIYKKLIDEKTAHVKIFYYSTSLFSIIFSE